MFLSVLNWNLKALQSNYFCRENILLVNFNKRRLKEITFWTSQNLPLDSDIHNTLNTLSRYNLIKHSAN